ncbi:MAG: flavodoxin domain-containing protein [Hungatella sp.]|nr:flavodoxin domain-containing protein [Hungatella sp.]
MVNNLILYLSKNNTTAETVELIKKNSKNPLDTYKITDVGNLDLSRYSHIYIGTGIYAGRIPEPVTKYISKHKNELINKPITFFLHGLASQKEYQRIADNAVSKYLDKKNYNCVYLGGKLDLAAQNFIIRKFMIEVGKKKGFDPRNANTLEHQKIRELAEHF